MRQKTFEKIFKEHLKIETYSKSIDSLYSHRLRNRINYKPYYQRNYVWDNNKATYFIESILIGTEIPPLIFFDNNDEIEIIDGRQRFETILRFMSNKFSLSAKGLNTLKQLKKCTYDDLASTDREIIDSFLDAKLRIIEFKLVNEPPLDKYLEDRIKKEIFSRYNSGITPLRKSEIDNAIYDEDNLSNEFKNILENNIELRFKIYSTFFKVSEKHKNDVPLENIMSFIRRFLVLPMFPINLYARGTGRTEVLTKLYEFVSDDSVDNEQQVINCFFEKVNFINEIKKHSEIKGLKINRLALECLLWGFGILDQEEIEYDFNDELIEAYATYVNKNINDYTEVDYAFNKEVMTRFLATSFFLEDFYKTNFEVYINADDLKKEELKEIRKPDDTSTKLSELETLRLNKPEPSRNSIDDIIRTMQRRRFLVRPSYQRKEVINPSKASSIIESVLLGITIPAIFVYKRKDGINEVIDGQQRILTLLGFTGAEYVDHKLNTAFSKNNKFKLRKLKILKKLEGKTFDQLNEDLQNKIYDFQLYVVEIDQAQNPKFDPIDLFIRLNDKPYPIRENSFEMWNSWVDFEIIKNIKTLVQEINSWLYLKQINKNTRDRMETEELVTSLVYLEYNKHLNINKKSLDIFQKSERINARIGSKYNISVLLQKITENQDNSKKDFLHAFKNVKGFIKKLKFVILDCDKENSDLFDYLKEELDDIFKAGKEAKYFRRTLQDFYIAWHLLNTINFEMVKLHRIEMKKEMKSIFFYMKNIPESDWLDNKGFRHFDRICKNFILKYTISSRRIKLTAEEKNELLLKQGGISGLSQAVIFRGDEIEVDHIVPIAKGGNDDIENLQIVHKDENRIKGSK
ncbi:DUF262 domain-containing protein [Marinifilum sp. N1E240]|uniref:GmrSD restriction endonuclease domain-containing protein n=1 Tax=Marinifilum sp. N1E240 TaxID=2608082 RepID=UPI00128D0869|nr:DUF262 domain-containing protein [Marinifilum sp. N1E240]MPQ48825.1 DUF262 domain-containing protein [Marinifilum sp. N1E240]